MFPLGSAYNARLRADYSYMDEQPQNLGRSSPMNPIYELVNLRAVLEADTWSAGWASFFLDTALDHRLASIVKKMRSGQELDESEIASAEQYLAAFCIRLENIEYQRSKLEFSGLDQLLEKQISQYSASPDFQRWWSEESKRGFSDEFVRAVNATLEEQN